MKRASLTARLTTLFALILSGTIACDDSDTPVTDAGSDGPSAAGGAGGGSGVGSGGTSAGGAGVGGGGGAVGGAGGGAGGADAAGDTNYGDNRPATWTADATTLDIGAIVTFACEAGGTFDTVYGTDYYTADSSICTAGVHSSLINQAGGGLVTIEVVAGRNQYLGSTRNSVSTANWGMYAKSFRFVGVTPHTDAGVGDAGGGLPIQFNVAGTHLQMGQQITYRCLPGTAGTIYGTDIYTADSSICSAAIHAGKTTVAGGTDFIVEWAPGQAMYTGSARNGVTSSNWGTYANSFRFP